MLRARKRATWDRTGSVIGGVDLPVFGAGTGSPSGRVGEISLGWKLALNLKLGADGFHPTSLVHFRQRLLQAGKSDMALRAVLEALEKEGFIAKRSKQRLDSTHILGAVARMSALECVRETLALALEELDGSLTEDQRPQFWEQLWEGYVESKLDYKSAEETLQSKRRQAGADCVRLLDWVEPLGAEVREAKGVTLLRKVFSQQYEVDQSGNIEPVKVHGTGVVQNPHDPDVQWSAKGKGKQKKDWVGYKVQVAETLAFQEDESSFITSWLPNELPRAMTPGSPPRCKNKRRWAWNRRRSCTQTGLTSRDERSMKPKKRGGNWWDRLNQALRAPG